MLPKSSFIPSKTEYRKITELVSKLRKGVFKKKHKKKNNKAFDLWPEDDNPEKWKSQSQKIPAPRIRFPG